MSTKEEFCNVDIHSCGGWQVAAVDCEIMKSDMPKLLAEWILYPDVHIERWPIEKFRKEGVMCECLKQARNHAVEARG